eukprot:TRINITY_DN802_c0_g1_i2.p1 TRINITY_DN802_c0_g1~~TRINITY_DN802_c0_g1_i2.p1  ORF type:complete len:297 (+),score=41.64 TRINITY_DN802_c0_g1_i2:77-967(+)
MGSCVSRKHPRPSEPRPDGPEYFTSNTTGLRIYTHAWPIDNHKACIFLCHGFGEHCHRYEHVAAELNKAGYSVFSMDHQGHGRSEGTRTHVERFSDFVDDVFQAIELARPRFNGSPLFIMGHSMGGAITTYSLIRNQSLFKGAVISAPLILNQPDIAKPHLIYLADKLSGVVPRLPVSPLDPNLISRDPETVKSYISDPYNYHGNIRVNFGDQVSKTLAMFQKEIHTITVPFIVLQGTADRVVNPRGAQFLYDTASSKDKTIRHYEGLFHEILNEYEKFEIIREIIRWLDSRVTPS